MRREDAEADPWWAAAAKGAVVLAAAFLGFALVPDRLADYLSARVSPTVRDVLLVLWWAYTFAVVTVLVVALQRARRG